MNFRSKYNTASEFLMRPMDSSSLGMFRILFGLLMVWSTVDYYDRGWVNKFFIDRKFNFTFEWFPWVIPLPGDGMYYIFAAMALAAFFLALGLFYRLAAIVFFLTYSYVFLLDKSLYNNHYYFICLLGFLFCFINANNWMSLDNIIKKKFWHSDETRTVPFWNIFLFKAQVFIVYFYGGIAKINFDWLWGEPVRHWLKRIVNKNDLPAIIANFLESEFATFFFSYGGLIFDLSIGFLLICKKTRLLGVGLLIFFNLSNSLAFNIGVFPFLMIASTILFFEPETPRKLAHRFFNLQEYTNLELASPPSKYKFLAMIFVSIYIAIQTLIPLRHWLYEGNVSWTEEGHYFSWHMKVRDKSNCRLKFFATNPQTGETWPIAIEQHLVSKQYFRMCIRPHMIIQYAKFLGKELESAGINNPEVYVRTRVSLNFRPKQQLIDPDVNLIKADYTLFTHADWILPLKDINSGIK
ncbi:MAG: HTTM domain-containing protein [Nitrospinales bacterium]